MSGGADAVLCLVLLKCVGAKMIRKSGLKLDPLKFSSYLGRGDLVFGQVTLRGEVDALINLGASGMRGAEILESGLKLNLRRS